MVKTEAELRAAIDDLKWSIRFGPPDDERDGRLVAQIAALRFAIGEEYEGYNLSRFLDRIRNIRIVGGLAVKTAKLTEKQFQQQVIDLARLCGWRVYHTHDSRRCVAGFPDLVLVHRKRGLVVFAELKVGNGKLTPEQEAWLDDLIECGQVAMMWHPDKWLLIERLLTGRDS